MRATQVRLDMTKPRDWLTHHRHHGRVHYEVKIGEWHRWLCTCGERFFFTDADREAKPKDYIL